MIRRIAAGLFLAIAALVAIVIVRTLLVAAPENEAVPTAPDMIDGEAAAARLGGAIRFRTVSLSPALPLSAGAFEDLAAYLETTYPKVHQALTHEQVGKFSLLYTWRGSDPSLPGLMVDAHMDVVPVAEGTAGDWTHAPFSGEVAEGFVWGRGTLDMKCSMLGVLEAVEYLIDHGFTPRRTIYLAFGHDEELDGRNGAGAIARLLKERGARIAFNMDEGSFVLDGVIPGVAKPVALIGLAEKGYLSLTLAARADGGHSSMPGRDEAIARIARAVQRLEDHQMPASLGVAVSLMLDTLAPDMPFINRAVIANRWLTRPLLIAMLEKAPASNAAIRTTTASTMIKGGFKDNVLPTEATAVVNFRILPGDTVESVIAHVRAVIDDQAVDIAARGANHDPSTTASDTSPGYLVVRSAVRAVFPDALVAPGLVIPSTDSRHYLGLSENSYRFLPVRMSAEDLRRIHGTNERISVRDYADMVRFYITLIRLGAA